MISLGSLSELLFPKRCVSCATLGITLCTPCRRGWNPHIYRAEFGKNSDEAIKVISSVTYSTTAQKIILGAKESHFKVCDALVSDAISHALSEILKFTSPDFLIPIPSRKSAARLRGRQFVEEVLREPAHKVGIPIASPLMHTRRVRDQSGLDLVERRNNIEGALVLSHKHGLHGRALLIDDLVTTGATLCEAARALRYAGIEVLGAVTAATAQPLR